LGFSVPASFLVVGFVCATRARRKEQRQVNLTKNVRMNTKPETVVSRVILANIFLLEDGRTTETCSSLGSTVDSRLSAVMVGRIGADNKKQRINRSTHTQARYTGIKLTGA
jgi:hypothetical protein